MEEYAEINRASWDKRAPAHAASPDYARQRFIEEADTYVETDATSLHTVTHSWNHGLGEIVTALMEMGLQAVKVRTTDKPVGV